MTDERIDQLRRSLIIAAWEDVNLFGHIDLPTLQLAKKIQTNVKKKNEYNFSLEVKCGSKF